VILYTYFRSSAAYRARLALSLKGIAYEARFVHLLRDGGEQFKPAYRRLNPLARVPTLIDGEQVFTQSVAIMEYLEEAYPQPAIMPGDPVARARVRAITQVLAADTQPLQNLVVSRYLGQVMNQPKPAIDEWTRHWMNNGLAAVEELLAGFAGGLADSSTSSADTRARAGGSGGSLAGAGGGSDGVAAGSSAAEAPFCVGNFATIADICLVAQCFASRRFSVPIERYPRVARIEAHCRALPAFRAAAPDQQPDFEP